MRETRNRPQPASLINNLSQLDFFSKTISFFNACWPNKKHGSQLGDFSCQTNYISTLHLMLFRMSSFSKHFIFYWKVFPVMIIDKKPWALFLFCGRLPSDNTRRKSQNLPMRNIILHIKPRSMISDIFVLVFFALNFFSYFIKHKIQNKTKIISIGSL